MGHADNDHFSEETLLEDLKSGVDYPVKSVKSVIYSKKMKKEMSTLVSNLPTFQISNTYVTLTVILDSRSQRRADRFMPGIAYPDPTILDLLRKQKVNVKYSKEVKETVDILVVLKW